MLIITNSHTDSIAVLASTSSKISAYQENCNELMLIGLEDARKAAVPRTIYEEDADSAFIGEALDLSSTEKLLAPVPALAEEGITEAPWPLPAYTALTHEGLLAVWWIVWDRSIKNGTRYPGLIAGSEDAKSGAASGSAATTSSPKPAQTPSNQSGSVFGQPSNASSTAGGGSVFGKPTATFGTPTNPQFGNTGFGSPAPALMKPTPPGFGTPGFGSTTPASSKPAQPAFGAPSTIGKPAQPAFGAPSTIGNPAQPAFGAPSTIGKPGATGFGAPGGLGTKPSPWGTSSQPSQVQANPFAASAGGSSGFAKFGQAAGGSNFSSFSSNNGTQSGFASLGQSQQKSAFEGLKTEPSFGSTITVASGAGSTLPSLDNTPAPRDGSIFGQSKSSFNTSSFESQQSDMSDADDAERRQRDEATPTPQPPPPQGSQGLFGLAGGFKLGTTFTSDGTAKDDPAKPAAPSNGSFFGSDFSNTLGATDSKPPATPSKETPQNASTTPTSPPKQKALFSNAAPAKASATPKAQPPPAQKSPVDDAPLPPDFITVKPAKVDYAPLPPDFINTKLPATADDDLPPLAGSPGIKVEAPSSSVEVSPIDNEHAEDESDFSDEEDDGDDEEEEEEAEESPPTGMASKSQPPKTGGWNFQKSFNQSPSVFPPAPTPPTIKSGATSQPGRSASPAQSGLFGQPARQTSGQPAYTGTPIFGQPQPQKALSSLGRSNQLSMPPKPTFPPPTNRTQDSLRSPSPVRSASTSALGTRREPLVARGTSLSSSVRQPKPPTPQPQVSDLEDDEDQRMREQLARPIEPSRTLDEFVAYQNYTGKSPSKTGHAAQIEMIYKDINGMVDALGWNARSIKSFTEYHKQPQPNHEVDRRTLEDVDEEGQDGSWFEEFTLCEIEALKALEEELEEELDAGRVQDVLGKLAQLARLLREKAKLMTRLNDIRRQIINRKDPAKTEALRKAPLPKELADGQKALRNDYAQLLTSLNKAEEAASILRSRIVSHNAQNGKTGAVPTMDAVKKTINKLTSFAEKRNNDITLLESQMRKIGIAEPSRPSSSSSRTAATPKRSRGTSLRNSVVESPFATPPTNRSKVSLSELNRRVLTPDADATPTTSKGYGLFYTPEGSPTPGNQLARMSDLVDENIDSLRETARRRKQVAAGLKKALVERGVKTTVVN